MAKRPKAPKAAKPRKTINKKVVRKSKPLKR